MPAGPILTIPAGRPAPTWRRGAGAGCLSCGIASRRRCPKRWAGATLDGARCLFESCIDDYGEIWINGECDRERATVQGFNVPQRVVVSAAPKAGDEVTIAILAMNGPLAAPGGAVFVRYATMAFEWREPGY